MGDLVMSKIIQVSDLYDNYHEINFGHGGIDLETGKMRYYSYYDSRQKFNIHSLYEFDLNNIDEDSFINWHMRHCKIKHTSSKKLPKKLEILVKDLINQHRQYNVINNYPVEYIDKNSANLLIEYQNNFSLFKDFEFCATYTPVENVIGLATAESKWSDLSNEDKMSLIHEIGHMKASSYSLDDGNNTLIVKEGFYISKIQLEPVLLENGDTFYKFIRAPKRGENYIGRALEEIINDLDCSLAFSLFNGNYPKLGKRLNDLCDKKLTYDRYSGGIEEVYTGLQKIIDSRDLADELLENIGNSIYGYYPEESENRALQLIKKYELSKKK